MTISTPPTRTVVAEMTMITNTTNMIGEKMDEMIDEMTEIVTATVIVTVRGTNGTTGATRRMIAEMTLPKDELQSHDRSHQRHLRRPKLPHKALHRLQQARRRPPQEHRHRSKTTSYFLARSSTRGRRST